METQFSSFTLLITLFLLSFRLIMMIYKKSNPDLPPGPWKLPLIGSLHHVVGYLPHHRLRDLAKKYGPIMHLQLGEATNIIISSPEIAKQVMKTHDLTFADRPFCLSISLSTYNATDIAFSPYGDYWRQLRKICTSELLSAARVQSFRSIREEETEKVVRFIASEAGSPINFSLLINKLTFSIITRTAFGKLWKGEEVAVPLVKKLVEASAGFGLANLYPSIKFLPLITGVKPRIERLFQALDKIFQNVIDEHKAKRAAAKTVLDQKEEEDAVDVLLKVQEEGNFEVPLTIENIKAVILDIFIAGTDTSSTPLDWAMSEMMKNPKVMAKAQAEVRSVFDANGGKVDETKLHELNYLKLVIKETLRLHPPVPLLVPRECRENCIINGYEIPKKSTVIVNAWAVGRDPDYWIEAEKFYPERFQNNRIDYRGSNFEFIPFGAGRRMCPGISFGMANVELPLAMLLYHFDWKLSDGLNPENLDMAEALSVTVKRKNDLYIIPSPAI